MYSLKEYTRYRKLQEPTARELAGLFAGLAREHGVLAVIGALREALLWNEATSRVSIESCDRKEERAELLDRYDLYAVARRLMSQTEKRVARYVELHVR